MFPVLFKFGSITVYSFGFFLSVAFLVASFILWREGKRQGYSEEKLLDLSILSLLSAIVGARANFVILNWNAFREEPLRIFMFWEGGLAYHGAALAVLLVLVFSTFRWKWPFFQIADIVSLAAAASLVIGKIGAFFAGFDYGKASNLPWSVKFPGLISSRHPVQLYEAASFFIILIFLYIIYSRNLLSANIKSGKVFFAFLITTSLTRLVTEYFRAQSEYLYGLPIAVWLSGIIAIVSLFGLYYFKIRSLSGDVRGFLKGFLFLNEKILRRIRF